MPYARQLKGEEEKMIIKRNVILGLIFLSMFSAIPLRAEEEGGTVPDLRTEHSEVVESGLSHGSKEEEKMKHDNMPKDKEHEGMHGMMGHDMKGWWIVIGVVMVIMMGAHVAVLF